MREMKDSGVDWIAHIPTNWTTNRMKYLFSNGKGLSITKENLIETGLPVISYGQIHSKDNSGTDIKDTLLRYVDFQYQANNPQCEVFQHDFVFADTSEDYDGCGNCVYKRDTSLLFGGYHAIIMHSLIKHDNRFFAYLFKTDAWRKQLREVASGVKVFSITQKALMNCSIIIPPEDEQKEISDFLDAKCSELDTAVSDIQSQIETLEEYKRSVITEAVTKGLNPDVEMRDSGVEWIGDIPAHWNIIRIGRLFHLRNEKNYKPMEEVQLLSLYTGIGVFPHGEQEERGNKAVTTVGYNIVKKNDIVVNIILAWMGAIGISEYDGVTSPAYDVYIPNLEKVVPHFFHYVFRTSGIAGECYKYGRGIMMMRWRTYSSEFKLINVPYPSLEEQQKIADYLDSKCAEIDSIITEKKKQIETIEEYKKSLIFEYVTGKKEVL